MNERRREFLRVCGLGGIGVMASPALAWATRIRVLEEAGDAGRPILLGQVSPDFQRMASGLRVGPAQAAGGLLVFWLRVKEAPAALEVATLEEARARGQLLITERDQATVPELLVENRGKTPVLLLAGEILLGGKQNRVLKEDILLPPLSGPRNIGVYCVEQGRWAGPAKGFESKGSFAAPGLRAKVLERADQGQVWAGVSEYARRAQAPSPTRSYQEVYEKKEVKDHLAEVERGIDQRAAPEALGAAVFVGGRLAGLDLFLDADLFAREWPKLLRAQALDAYREPSPAEAAEARLRGRVEALLRLAASVEGTLREGAGLGRLFEFRLKGARGTALVFDDRVIHAAIL